MARLTRESNVFIGNKEIKVEEILATIIYLPAEQVKGFFYEIGLTIPRELRIFVLRELLRERVIETRKSRLTLADELNYRLSWFSEFTETQLENLLVFYDDRDLDKLFLEDFWTDLFAYLVDKGVPPKDLKRLVDASIAHVKVNGFDLPNVRSYNRELKDLFYDSLGRIDGLTPAKIRPVLYKSSTLSEIRDLGSKYDVDVPRRLKKNELADIIVTELKDRGQHTDALEQEVRGMSVLVLQRFAINNDIKASTELKKEEIIEYILKNAKETKESYFVPESIEAYDKEVTEIAEEPIEEVPVFEPIEEEVAEEIVEEETVVEEEVVEVAEEVYEEIPVQYVQSTVDLTDLVEEVKRLRLAVEALLEEDEYYEEEEEEEEFEVVQENETAEFATEDVFVLNTTEYVGQKKFYKKLAKQERREDVEPEIEPVPVFAEQMVYEEPKKDKQPIEVRVFKVLLKIILLVVATVLVLFLIYGLLTFFVDIQFLNGFSNTINSVEINDKGVLQHFHDFLNSLGLNGNGYTS